MYSRPKEAPAAALPYPTAGPYGGYPAMPTVQPAQPTPYPSAGYPPYPVAGGGGGGYMPPYPPSSSNAGSPYPGYGPYPPAPAASYHTQVRVVHGWSWIKRRKGGL